ncbi:MAG: DUF3000 domain-containing protein [Nakamurella sp.]
MGKAGSRTLVEPAEFRQAVAGLSGSVLSGSGLSGPRLSGPRLRSGTEIGELPSPTQLAPHTYAVSVEVNDGAGVEAATGRLILLHDPDGVDAWEGTLRVVAFGACEIDTDMAADVLLPDVAWSWLTEGLAERDVDYVALGGTITITSSNRFGDIAGPPRINELELRASWTAQTPNTAAHLAAFVDFLATAAGLPPEGVAAIREQDHPFATKFS